MRARPAVFAGQRAEVVARCELPESDREPWIGLVGRIPELDQGLVTVVDEAVVQAIAIALADKAHVERATSGIDDAGDNQCAHRGPALSMAYFATLMSL